MNHKEPNGRIFRLSVCALVSSLFLVTTAASAQSSSAKSADANAKTSATVTVADTKIEAGSGTPPAVPGSESKAPQDSQVAEQLTASEDEEFDVPPLQVGDATLNLLAWQRSGEIASPTARPIAGSVANRSYERYLKSFEHAIPERLGSTVSNSRSGAGNSSSSSR